MRTTARGLMFGAVLFLAGCPKAGPSVPVHLEGEPPEAAGVLTLTDGSVPFPKQAAHLSSEVVAAIRPQGPVTGKYGILVGEDGKVQAAWIAASAFPWDPSVLAMAKATEFAPYRRHGALTKWKTEYTWTLEPGPLGVRRFGWVPIGAEPHLFPEEKAPSLESALRFATEKLPPISSADDITALYATSIELSAGDRKLLQDAAVRAWDRVAKEEPSLAGVAAGMKRQVLAAAVLLGDASAADSAPVGTARSGTPPRGWRDDFHPIPFYPPAASVNRTSGTVEVEIDLDPAGVTRSAKLVRSSDPSFEKSALVAATLGRFASSTAMGAGIHLILSFPPDPSGFAILHKKTSP